MAMNAPPSPETVAKVEADLLAKANASTEPLAPELLGKTVAESGLTVHQVIDLVRRVSGAVVAERENAAAERMRGIADGTIVDNGVAGSGNTEQSSIVYKDFAAVTGRPHPRQFSPGALPKLPQYDKVGKEEERLSEFFDEACENRSLAKNFHIQSRHRVGQAKSNSMTTTNPAFAGLLTPSALETSLLDYIIATVPWTNMATVIRSDREQFEADFPVVNLAVDADVESRRGFSFGYVGEDGEAGAGAEPTWRTASGKNWQLATTWRITRRQKRNAPDAWNRFLGMLGDEVTRHIIRKTMRGTGVGQPLGFLNQVHNDMKPTIVNRGTAGAVTFDDLLTMRQAIPNGLGSDSIALMREKTRLSLLRERTDTGELLFTVPYNDTNRPIGLESNLFWWPCYHTDDSPVLGETGDVVVMYPAAIWQHFRDGLELASSEHVEFKKGSVVAVAWQEWGTGVVPTWNPSILALGPEA